MLIYFVLVHGGWSIWEDWSSCSMTCGDPGMKSRSRLCNNPTPEHNGAFCTGDISQESNCPALLQCPIDGDWSEWTQFGDCSVTCGNTGVIERSRTCDSPEPQFNGMDCVGKSQEDVSCPGNIFCPGTITTTSILAQQESLSLIHI